MKDMYLKLLIYLFSYFNSTNDISNNNKGIPLSLYKSNQRENS